MPIVVQRAPRVRNDEHDTLVVCMTPCAASHGCAALVHERLVHVIYRYVAMKVCNVRTPSTTGDQNVLFRTWPGKRLEVLSVQICLRHDSLTNRLHNGRSSLLLVLVVMAEEFGSSSQGQCRQRKHKPFMIVFRSAVACCVQRRQWSRSNG